MLENTTNAQGFFYTTLNKPGVCADIPQACPLWKMYSHNNNFRTPLEIFVTPSGERWFEGSREQGTDEDILT
jgi:hypothetical protein